MRCPAADHRPDEAQRLLFHTHDQLARHYAVGERDDPRPLLEACVGDEPWSKAAMDGTHIPDHVPHLRGRGVEGQLLTDRSHGEARYPRYTASTLLPSGSNRNAA